MAMTYYPAILDQTSEGIGVSLPDFPGVIAHGANPTEAIIQIQKALMFHIDAMRADGDTIPPPSDLDVVKDIGCLCAMILIDVPIKVDRVLISIDSNLLRSIDAVTNNRSAWMCEAAKQALKNN